MKTFSHQLADQEYLIQPAYLTAGSKRRPGVAMVPGVKFIVAHDTGNPGSTAKGNVNYYQTTRDKISASAHIFVDSQQIIECIPALTAPPEKAWHVLYNRTEDNALFGFNSNDAAIGVEYCYGDNINADEAYRKYIWVMAYACWRYQLNPAKSIVGHHFLDPKRKTDPVTGLMRSRRSYSQMLLDVVEIHKTGTPAIPATAPIHAGTFPSTVEATAWLNVRAKEPFRRALLARQIPPRTIFSVAGIVQGEPVNGINKWYDLGNNEFCWSGAVKKST